MIWPKEGTTLILMLPSGPYEFWNIVAGDKI